MAETEYLSLCLSIQEVYTSLYKFTVSEAKGLRVHIYIDLASDEGHID